MAPAAVVTLVPVKAFSQAKRRLAPTLGPAERSALSRAMADGVLAAASAAPVAVACDDVGVAQWAELRGARVIWTAGLGLDGAVARGLEVLAADGHRQVIVAHADLPLATDLTRVARFPGVTIVPDRHDDGTNVLCVPAASSFPFAYGPGSFRRHHALARTLGHDVRIARLADLSWDVDVPDDLVAISPAGV